MPIQAQAVAALATDPQRGQGAMVRKLVARFVGGDVAVAQAQARIRTALGLAPGDRFAPLLHNDLVAARTANGMLVAWVVADPGELRAILAEQVSAHHLAKRSATGGYARYARPGWSVAVTGALIVVGRPAAVTTALADHARGAGMTPQLFADRLRGLPAGALLRVEGNLAIAARAQRSKVPWLRSLNHFAMTVRADDTGLHALLRAAGGAVAPGDLPLAPDAAAPAPLARANGATVGVSDLRHLIRFGLQTLRATDPGAYRRYDLARRALKLLRGADVDRDVIGQLGGTATIWSPDLRTFSLSEPVADPARMTRALSRLKPLMGPLLAAAGLAGARYGVAGDTFVVTTTPGVSLTGLASGSPQRIGSLAGAATGVIRAEALRRALIERLGLPPIASLALGALGDTTFAVRTAPTGVEASADVAIR